MTLAPPDFGVAAYGSGDGARWDEFVANSSNGTFLHTRRFLSYHGSRFRDRSLLVTAPDGRLAGLLPAAEDPGDAGTVISHPGITYGGLVHGRSLRGAAVVNALRSVGDRLAELGYERLIYKAVPTIYHHPFTSDDVYALAQLRASRSRCALSATVDLAAPVRPSHGRRSGQRTADRAGVRVSSGWDSISEFWRLLELTLSDRFDAAPTHSLDEISHLHSLFPEHISLITGRIASEVVAGILLFQVGPTLHAQYIASGAQGRATSALDPVITRALELARESQCRFFDFGTSSVDESDAVNQALYEFKLSFGAGSVAQEQYILDLAAHKSS